MKKIAMIIACLAFASTAFAVPVLQVGAPAPSGSGEGTYANYVNSTNPDETDTAITSGGTLFVAGVYQNQRVLNLGGMYQGGLDWSSFIPSALFDGKGAILVVSVPEGDTGTISIPGATFLTSSLTDSYFPNNHAPVQDGIADFFFYDIGSFTETPDAVPDFDSETGAADGEIKTFTGITVTGYDWVHFDVMALETLDQDDQQTSMLRTNWEGNPGSHDVTWKGDGAPPEEVVPEPGTFILMGVGLAALGLYRRARRG